MKTVYYFQLSTGEYISSQGISDETYSDLLAVINDVNFTLIEPPFILNQNEVAVFDKNTDEWNILPDFRGYYINQLNGKIVYISNFNESPPEDYTQIDSSDAKLLIEARESKINQLKQKYIDAQNINVQLSGLTFKVTLMGSFFNDVERQVKSAEGELGQADLIATNTDGEECYIPNIPRSAWLSFYAVVKPLSTSNLGNKITTEQSIRKALTVEDVDAINIDIFPPIQTIEITI